MMYPAHAPKAIASAVALAHREESAHAILAIVALSARAKSNQVARVDNIGSLD